MTDDADLKAFDLVPLASSSRGCVVIESKLKSAFDALDDKIKSQFLAIMDLWIEGRTLTDKQFNGNEGRAKRGSTNVMLCAFKRFKIRLYGFVHGFKGRRSFVIVELDPAKKQDKADPKILSRAKARALDLVETLEG